MARPVVGRRFTRQYGLNIFIAPLPGTGLGTGRTDDAGDVGAADAGLEENDEVIEGAITEVEGSGEVTEGATTEVEGSEEGSMKEAILGPGIGYGVSGSMVQISGKTTP